MTAAMEEMGQNAMFLNVTDHLHQHVHHLVRVDMTAAMEEMGQSAMFLNVTDHLHQMTISTHHAPSWHQEPHTINELADSPTYIKDNDSDDVDIETQARLTRSR